MLVPDARVRAQYGKFFSKASRAGMGLLEPEYLELKGFDSPLSAYMVRIVAWGACRRIHTYMLRLILLDTTASLHSLRTMQDRTQPSGSDDRVISSEAEGNRRLLHDLVVGSPACAVMPFGVHGVVRQLLEAGASFATLRVLAASAPVLMAFVQQELGSSMTLPVRAKVLLQNVLDVAAAAYTATTAVRKRKRTDNDVPLTAGG